MSGNIPWLKWDHVHPLVLQCLMEKGFAAPTDVQSYTLSTYKHYNDFIIASKTGSGKTLSFGIPILSEILFQKQGSVLSKKQQQKSNYLRGIIVAPTRELALQIEKHIKLINKKSEHLVSIIALVGGISKEKQLRLLSYSPDLIVCTPGRLWDLIEEQQHSYLQKLDQLEYFVMDEADRMVELGHFDDLDKIIQRIFSKKTINHDKKIFDQILQQSEPTVQELNDEEYKKTIKKEKLQDEEFGEDEDFDQFVGDDIVEMDEKDFLQQQKNKKNLNYQVEEMAIYKEGEEEEEELEEVEEENEEDQEDGNEEEEELKEQDEDEEEEDGEDDWDINDGKHSDEELDEENQEEEEEDFDEEEENDGEEIEGQEQLDNLIMNKNQLPKKNTKKKVFLVSATITQHFRGKQKFKISKKEIKSNKDKLKKENDKIEKEEEKKKAFNLKIQALLSKIKFSGKPKLIDLTSDTLFPEKLKEFKSVLEEEDKILYLYHYIQENIDQNFIIFCNSISYAKKVTHLLDVLKLPAVMLHSEMQQRQRLKKLDQFKSKERNILVCTDVAARGLDIPKVQNVVHYQVPMDIDTYVHRSGRTARIGQDGTSYVLIGPKDSGRYNQLCKQLNKEQGLEGLELTVKEKQKIGKLVQSAIQFEKKQYQLQKKQQEAVWYKKMSKNADVELDEELQKELQDINDEVTKKRVVTNEYKSKHTTVVKDVKNIDRSRRNALFLDPSQIQEYAKKIRNIKDNVKEQKLKSQEKKSNKQKHQEIIQTKLKKQQKLQDFNQKRRENKKQKLSRKQKQKQSQMDTE